MASCDYCGTTILFGGIQDHGLRFCSKKCHEQGIVLAVSAHVPDDIVSQQVTEVHQGKCPKCGGPGPIDVHTSHIVWSALVLTSWKSRPEVCCRACGIKAKLSGALLSGIAGWWGFPWGILVTPVQVLRNLAGLFSSPNPNAPSPQLGKLIRANLAAHIATQIGQTKMEAGATSVVG